LIVLKWGRICPFALPSNSPAASQLPPSGCQAHLPELSLLHALSPRVPRVQIPSKISQSKSIRPPASLLPSPSEPSLQNSNPTSPYSTHRIPQVRRKSPDRRAPMTMVRCPSRFPSTPTREIHDFPLLIRSDCLLRSCSCRWCLFDLMDWMGAAAGAGRGRGGRRGGRRGAGSALRVQAGAAHHQLPLRRYASASRRLRVC
jgi:hypothetical protein